MANTLSVSRATLVGGTSFLEYTFTVTDGATTISDKHYFFSANNFSAVYYDDNPNIGILHLGIHQITLSNGDYSTLTFDGAPYATIDLLIIAFVTDIAQYTT